MIYVIRRNLELQLQNISKEKRAFGICKGHARQVAWFVSVCFIKEDIFLIHLARSSQGDYILTRLQHNILLWEAPVRCYSKLL